MSRPGARGFSPTANPSGLETPRVKDLLLEASGLVVHERHHALQRRVHIVVLLERKIGSLGVLQGATEGLELARGLLGCSPESVERSSRFGFRGSHAAILVGVPVPEQMPETGYRPR